MPRNVSVILGTTVPAYDQITYAEEMTGNRRENKWKCINAEPEIQNTTKQANPSSVRQNRIIIIIQKIRSNKKNSPTIEI